MSRLLLGWMTTALLASSSAFGQDDDRPFLSAALEVAQWLESVGTEEGGGKSWPADPENPEVRPAHLYSGSAGVVLFFLELHAATEFEPWLHEASAGATALRARLPRENAHSLYTGIAGLGFVFGELYRTTKSDDDLEAFRSVVRRLGDEARASENGIDWNDVTDVIGGSAGTGLFLLWAAEVMGDPDALALAVRTGDRLLELGPVEEGRRSWKMSPTFARTMPNFSHGTAGVAYFLARLARTSGEERFLQAAKEGVAQLDALAKREDHGYLVHHNRPDGLELFYLGWCHGPTGTHRLFYELWRTTGDESYRDRIRASARSILASGIPEARPEGFWNNVGQCCGSAGVAQAFHEMARHLDDETLVARYNQFAEHLTRDLLQRATRDEQGLRWIQAEHRVRPELLVAQTGYAQGAAGIGLWLLTLDAHMEGRPRRVVLPDSPYGGW